MGFHWQTDEESEAEWADSRPDGELQPFRLSAPRPLFILLVVILSLGGYYAHRALQKHAAAREAQIIADVLASYKLLNQAVEANDLEVLRSVLSGSNTQWSQEQQSELLNQYLLKRPFKGWEHLPQDHGRVLVNPSFSEVQITITQTYQIDNNLPLHRAQLVQTAIFRQGEHSWLYTNPTAGFWGSEQRLQGDHITLVYPARDESEAEALFNYLEPLIAAYCRMLDNCGRSLGLTLTLETDPNTMASLFNQQEPVFSTTALIQLPTITLIGRPVDKRSEQALFGVYGAYVIGRINQRLVVKQRLEQHLFDQILLDEQLAALNLPQQSVPTAALLEPAYWTNLSDYKKLWELTNASVNDELSGRAQQLLLFVETLNPYLSPLERQRQLESAEFEEWVSKTTEQSLAQVERAWLQYVHEQQALDRLPPTAAAYTDQLLGMLCIDESNTAAYVTLNPFTEPRWSTGSSLGSVLDAQFVHYALPADDGFIIEEMPRRSDDTWYTLLVRNNGELFYTFDSTNFPMSLEYTGYSPSHDVNRLLMSAPNPDFGFVEFYILNLEQCTAADCPLALTDGFPLWSPDGQRTILLSFQGLHLGDEKGQRLERLGRGESPFWINNHTLAYLRSFGFENRGGVLISKNGLVISPSDNQEQKQFVYASSFEPIIAPILKDAAERATFSLEYATTNAINGRIYLVGTTLSRNQFYLLEFNLETSRSRLLLVVDELPGRLTFAPDGRWLTLTAFPRSNANLETEVGRETATLHLIDLFTNHKISYTFQRLTNVSRSSWLPDWSADGRWFIINDGVSIHLMAPQEGYQQRIFHQFTSCQDAAWLNR